MNSARRHSPRTRKRLRPSGIMRIGSRIPGFLVGLTAFAPILHTSLEAQIDPIDRRLFQIGYAQPLREHGPLAAYAFYYHNQPGFIRTNLTLRLAVAPVYLDSELGIREAIGPHTDLALGLTGGGFADSYNELRRGDFITGESFQGHAAELNSSLYHRFNPAQSVPLSGIVRSSFRGSFFSRDTRTDPDFDVPGNLASLALRAGLRLGGREPYLSPYLAGEISLWYQTDYRFNPGSYGFDRDRRIREHSHQFWSRALLAYTFPESQHHFELSLTAGTSLNADRLSAYRLGSSLPLVAEFPLSLPGYHIEEVSADQFALLHALILQPVDPAKSWNLLLFGSVAVVDYLPGLDQPGHWHTGLGGGLLYQSPSGAWEIGTAYSYGPTAMREGGRGAHTLTLMIQYDLDALFREGHRPFWDPVLGAKTWQGILGRLGRQ
jgi:hypothetical protein